MSESTPGWTLQRTAWLLVTFWALLCVSALADHLHALAITEDRDPLLKPELETKLSLEMTVINAPISVLVIVTSPVLPGEGPVGEWFWMTLAGFVQWVILVPAIFSRFRRVFAQFDAENEAERSNSGRAKE